MVFLWKLYYSSEEFPDINRIMIAVNQKKIALEFHFKKFSIVKLDDKNERMRRKGEEC